DAAYVRDAILTTFATMRTRTPDPTRIADIKRALKYGFAAGMDNSEALADAVVPVLAPTRDVETLNAIYRRYDAVTPEDVRAVADRYFSDAGLVVTTLAHGELAPEAMRAGSVEALAEGMEGGATPASDP